MRRMVQRRIESKEPCSSSRFLVTTLVQCALRTYFWVSFAILAELLPAPVGALGTVVVCASSLYRYRLWGSSPGRTVRARAEVRLRPMHGKWTWFCGALAAFMAFDIGFTLLWFRLVPPSSTPALNPTKVSVVTLCLVGPVVEEAIFRGWLLRQLERRFTRGHASVVASLAFALLHLQLTGIPVRFFVGLGAALALYATRSLWSAVLIHMAHNAFVVTAATSDVEKRFGEAGWLSMAIAVVGGLVGLATANWVWRRKPRRLTGMFPTSRPVSSGGPL